jgi:hypothetical protein
MKQLVMYVRRSINVDRTHTQDLSSQEKLGKVLLEMILYVDRSHTTRDLRKRNPSKVFLLYMATVCLPLQSRDQE